MDWSVVVVLAVIVGLGLWVWWRSETAADQAPPDADDPTDTGDSGYRP